jgi:ATP-dependent Lon protease
VIMLDEVDKLGRDFRGDPASALLETLDPEQNNTFRDNYLDVPFDLSKVLFICTANMLDTVPPPLLDRMELIFLQGYSEEEKVHIANRYLIPRQIKENGITRSRSSFPRERCATLVRHYTREAGVRKLEQDRDGLPQAGAARGRGQDGKAGGHARGDQGVPGRHPGARGYRGGGARQAARRGRGPGVDAGRRRHPLHRGQQDEGQGRLHHDRADRRGDAGVDAGRADLGALERRSLGLAEDFTKEIDLHIHVPAGAIPKDGPFGGVTMATVLVSLLTDTPVRPLTAMTGEITLSGNVLPVGGIKEKFLAARRAGVRNHHPARREPPGRGRGPDAGD